VTTEKNHQILSNVFEVELKKKISYWKNSSLGLLDALFLEVSLVKILLVIVLFVELSVSLYP